MVPIFNVESVEPGERVEQLTSRRKVEFESIDFNRRYLATVPADHDPVALRELFSPGFLDWAAQIRNRVEFGITDRQLYFIWHLSELSADEYGDCARPRRGPVRAPAQRDGRARPAHLPPGPWHAGLESFPDAADEWIPRPAHPDDARMPSLDRGHRACP